MVEKTLWKVVVPMDGVNVRRRVGFINWRGFSLG